MNPFIAAVILTILFWISMVAVSWFLTIRVRRFIRFLRHSPGILKNTAKVFGAATLIALSISAAQFQIDIGIVILFLVLSPFIALLFAQIAFWAYHAIAHGNPFHERLSPSEKKTDYIVLRGAEQKREKFCIICKRKTHCRVNKSPTLGWVHVVQQ